MGARSIGSQISAGAATVGVASAVGALIAGCSSDILREGAIEVAIGGPTGAVSGAFYNDEPAPHTAGLCSVVCRKKALRSSAGTN